MVIVEQRRNRLLEVVRLRGFASLPDLKKELEVSESTIRRDLDYLEESGVAKRTRGGVLYTGPSPKLQYFEDRQPAQWAKKKAIAQRVVDLIEDGDTVMLGGGSTVYEIAQLLVGRTLQVVTNSLPVANLFASAKATDLVFIGGYIYPRTGVSLGPYANGMLSHINVRRTILSVGGITERGFFNSNLLLVETEQAMMRAADEVIIAADSTKCGHKSLAFVSELSAVDRLVVDDEIDDLWRSKIKAAGVKLTLAHAPRESVPTRAK